MTKVNASYKRHLIQTKEHVRSALERLDELASDAILFLVNDKNQLIGSFTDGDIRRGLIGGLTLESPLTDFIQKNPKYFRDGSFDLQLIKSLRENNFKIVPVVNDDDVVIEVVNFTKQKSNLPLDAIIMAGGVGSRLKPLTDNTPKPLLRVGKKPIVEYNIDQLQRYGIKNVCFSIKYLGNQIIDYFKDGSERSMNITYVTEDKPLGTIGAVSKVDDFRNDHLIVMNSDILTNINFEDMFEAMLRTSADMVVATVPYEVKIPYGVIEINNEEIIGLREKPTYTYYSNAGIYILKKSMINHIPLNEHFNATDLIELLFNGKGKVVHFPIKDYWLDIGKPHDFEKAQKDILHLKF